jgi:hypothetical protein
VHASLPRQLFLQCQIWNFLADHGEICAFLALISEEEKRAKREIFLTVKEQCQEIYCVCVNRGKIYDPLHIHALLNYFLPFRKQFLGLYSCYL